MSHNSLDPLATTSHYYYYYYYYYKAISIARNLFYDIFLERYIWQLLLDISIGNTQSLLTVGNTVRSLSALPTNNKTTGRSIDMSICLPCV